MQNTGIAIFGAGTIGWAAHYLITNEPITSPFALSKVTIFDTSARVQELKGGQQLDVNVATVEQLATKLREVGAGYVINALPFFLNTKIASAALAAGCHYIDFTEDDAASDAVQATYAKQDKLMCATKCGLAPGFVNYIGIGMVEDLRAAWSDIVVEHLRVRVGALPANVRYDNDKPQDAYAMSWSIDGLVNEYIRPCRIKQAGVVFLAPPLLGEETIVINGSTYEARYTSGGVGSLVTDFPEIPNIDYKTLRHPGHYAYVEQARIDAGWGRAPMELIFEELRATFKRDLAWTDNDIIVVFAEAVGRTLADGNKHVRNFAAKYGKVWPLTGIQTTTAGGALAVLELMLEGKLSKPIISHRDIPINKFLETRAFKITYGAAKCS